MSFSIIINNERGENQKLMDRIIKQERVQLLVARRDCSLAKGIFEVPRFLHEYRSSSRCCMSRPLPALSLTAGAVEHNERLELTGA